jgi:tetratricopeptide (TPR) repeat protein
VSHLWNTVRHAWEAASDHVLKILPTDQNGRIAVLGLVVAVLFGLASIPSTLAALRSLYERRRVSGGLICPVRSFKPARIVNAYGVRKFSEYWPISADAEIDAALRQRSHVLLVGRPHVGKSRAAVHHIRKIFGSRFQRWHVIHPYATSIDEMLKIPIAKRRYVLLLDDLDAYVVNDKAAGVGILELIQHLQHQATELVVIGTIRRTLPEFDAPVLSPKLLGRWRNIDISDWALEQGSKLAKIVGGDLSSWDGTPLSIIQPSALMAERYRTSTPQEKRAMRGLKLCAHFGFSFVPRDLFFQVCELPNLDVGVDDAVDASVIQSLHDKGFLSGAIDWIQAYPAYLGFVKEWSVVQAMERALESTLVTHGWPRQLVVLSWFRMQGGDLDGARQACEGAVRLDPSNPNYKYRLGVIFSRSHLWDRASECFKEATHLSPDWQAAWYRLARSLSEQRKSSESAAAFREARALGSSNAELRYRRAELLRLEGRFDDAVEENAEAVSLDPKDAEPWQAYGRALREQSRWKEAAAAHQKAIALRPDWAEAYFGLGEPLFKMGDLPKAEEAYRKALSLKPDLVVVYTYLSVLLETDNRPSDAEAVLRQGVKCCPMAPRIHSYLGQLLTQQRKNPDALYHFQIAVQLMPSYSEAQVGLAAQQRLLSRKDSDLLDEAIKNNKLALEFEPGNESAYFGLAMCYRQREDWKNAVSTFGEAIRCDPKMGAAWYYCAEAQRHLGVDTEEVLASFRRAEANGYNRFRVQLECAKVFAEGGYISDAFAALQAAATARGVLPYGVAKDPAFSSIRSDKRFLELTKRSSRQFGH